MRWRGRRKSSNFEDRRSLGAASGGRASGGGVLNLLPIAENAPRSDSGV
jgi:predicted metalloprotease